MTPISYEKRNTAVPRSLTPDTVYFVKGTDGNLQIHVSDALGQSTITTATGRLVTTPPTLIHGNRIRLPSLPAGDLLFGIMYVYDDQGIVTEYDSVTVGYEIGGAYAVLNEPYVVVGHGVVSYLTGDAT
jgi:hypothetical protein